MSPPSPKPTLALFGSTGGCINTTLRLALAAGYEVTCLIRTPSKLSSLAAQYPNLHLVPGDIYDLPSIKEALVEQETRRVVDIVISGVGMVMQRNGLGFTSTQPEICEMGTRNILHALGELESEGKGGVGGEGPRIVLLSTTGISSRGRDIPLAMIPLYHWMLAVPHADKRKMEDAIIESGRRFVCVRPSLLMHGKGKGLGSLRVGIEVPGEDGGNREIGYTISREDVGAWLFEECVQGEGGKWEGKCVSLTY